MNRRIIFGLIIVLALFVPATITSANSNNVVISTIQTGDTLSASNEQITIFNNSNLSIDVTGWCLYYINGAASHTSKLVCFESGTSNLLFLPAKSYAVAASTQLQGDKPRMIADTLFSATLAQSSGHVKLLNQAGIEIDRVGWGAAAISPEMVSADAPGPGFMIERKMIDGVYIDTANNSFDFTIVAAHIMFPYGNLLEVADVCENIDGFQGDVPEGYTSDIPGLCTAPIVDECSNIDGIQSVVPQGYGIQDTECYQDVCQNIDGLQTLMPENYSATNFLCTHDLLSLTLTELHPNPTGGDAGHEFIEIYNPNEVLVSLADYQILVGNNGEHRITFSDLDVISPHSFMAIYNNTYTFTLVNTTSIVRILSKDGLTEIDATPSYHNAKDGMSWAIIDGVWVYTNRATPGEQNLPSLEMISVSGTTESTLKACPAGQYRNLETNRCRLVTSVTTLTPCAAGEERNPSTNRCRKVVVEANQLVACKEGQERNPETNRCRNIVSKQIPESEYGVMGATTQKPNYLLWATIIVVIIGGIGYAIWEWRFETKKLLGKIGTFIRRRK